MRCNRFKTLQKTHIVTYDRQCNSSFTSAVIASKKADIISRIFQLWVSVYGLPEKFLSDDCGEFANDHFNNMCKAMNINFKLTSAESPWNNRLVEKHVLILGHVVSKFLEESKNNIDTAVTRAINAKNSLTNVHGFSTYQLAIGQNHTLPSAATGKPPALKQTPTTKQDKHSSKVRILRELKELSTTTSEHTAIPVF